MAQPGFADSILKERPVSTVRQDSSSPLQSSSVSESPGYHLYRKRGGQELSLLLEMANGDILAPEYTYLVNKKFLRSEGMIVLRFTDSTIKLIGRNLKEIFLHLCRHSVANIVEIPLKEDHFDKEASIIHEIQIESVYE